MATEELNSGCSRKDAASREAFLAYPARVRGVKASLAWVSTRHCVGVGVILREQSHVQN
jgi:hypothetical protein